MNGSYYQGNAFPGVGLNNNTVPNQQSVPSYETNKNNTMFDIPTSMSLDYANNHSLENGCKVSIPTINFTKI